MMLQYDASELNCCEPYLLASLYIRISGCKLTMCNIAAVKSSTPRPMGHASQCMLADTWQDTWPLSVTAVLH